jgi:Fe-S-cluster containining protein
MRNRSGARLRHASQCLGCGGCCEEFGDTLAAEEADLARWRSQGRQDLLARVGEGGALWVDPQTGEDLDRCPFLERTGPDTAHCSIHATKPDMCRAYPDDSHGFHCVRGVRFRRVA